MYDTPFLPYLMFLLLPWSALANLDSVCYPDTEEARNWPVGVIYLHGYHPWPGYEHTNPNGPPTEQNNRRIWQQLAEQAAARRIRIALPASPHHFSGRYGTNRFWNGNGLIPIDRVEQLASEACSGADLAQGRILVGFSDGGHAVKHHAGDCARMASYSRILSIGAPGGARTSNPPCNTLRVHDPHSLPAAGDLATMMGLDSVQGGPFPVIRPGGGAVPLQRGVIEEPGGGEWGTE